MQYRLFSKKLGILALALASSALLSACTTTSPGATSREDKINTVMEKAAASAHNQGQTQQSLALLEQLYKRNSSDPQAATQYAAALRREGYYNRAALVLKPFTASSTATGDVMVEYASIQAAMGNYLESEEAARKAVKLESKNGQAYHVLGIALDAQGHHEQAHVAFEKGLEYWEGNPSAILNNLGLNLAAQGFLDEAIDTLRKAMDTAPNRTEIERNLRIVSALQYQPPREGTRLMVPKPARKPGPPSAAEKDAQAAKALKQEFEEDESMTRSSAVENVEAEPLTVND